MTIVCTSSNRCDIYDRTELLEGSITEKEESKTHEHSKMGCESGRSYEPEKRVEHQVGPRISNGGHQVDPQCTLKGNVEHGDPGRPK